MNLHVRGRGADRPPSSGSPGSRRSPGCPSPSKRVERGRFLRDQPSVRRRTGGQWHYVVRGVPRAGAHPGRRACSAAASTGRQDLEGTFDASPRPRRQASEGEARASSSSRSWPCRGAPRGMSSWRAGYAYVVAHEEGLYIYDISNPAAARAKVAERKPDRRGVLAPGLGEAADAVHRQLQARRAGLRLSNPVSPSAPKAFPGRR